MAHSGHWMDAVSLFIPVISDQMHASKLLTDLIHHPDSVALFLSSHGFLYQSAQQQDFM